jgi:antitoxin component YwqK of YwqJK toxin-antitoxin module
MNKLFYALFIISITVSCGEDSKTKKQIAPEKEENLVEMKDGMYIEWYPGKKQVKFKGPQDENKKRHGIWKFYSETGNELSYTVYEHGLKTGHTIVKYPNGTIHYTGEYRDDKAVGVWKIYDPNGKLKSKVNKGQ